MASHTVLKEQLQEMGFDAELIDAALSLLKEKATLESVLEVIESGKAQEEAERLKNNPGTDPSECLTQTPSEEIEKRKKAVEEKLKQRRKEIEDLEKAAEKEREIQRRKDGRDMGKMRDELQRMQHENYVKNMQREKEEEKAAREAIRRKIEQDKADRRERFAGSVATTTVTTPPTTATPPARPSDLYNTGAKDGKTKLAIRLADNTNMIQEFDAKEVLSAVRAFIVTQKNIDYNITLAMPLRPPFSEEDMDKSLLVLGLVPNARLQVIRR